MADRTSARVFGLVFKALASDDFDPKRLARKLMKEAQDFDFNAYQMGCDDALIALGVAKSGLDEDYPEDKERVLYLYEDYRR